MAFTHDDDAFEQQNMRSCETENPDLEVRIFFANVTAAS